MKKAFLIIGLLFIVMIISISALPAIFCRDSDALKFQDAFPVIKTQQVSVFTNYSWCRAISYTGGKFTDLYEGRSCDIGIDPALRFNSIAEQDFRAILDILQGIDPSVTNFYTLFTKDGDIEYLSFSVDVVSLFCLRQDYIYKPKYREFPQAPPGDTQFYRINENWYKMESD